MFLIKQNSKEPIFEQICSQMKHFISVGILVQGEKLPSVRNLAQDLGINPNTVAKAYALLEGENVIVSSYKRGYFVGEGNVKDAWKKQETEVLKEQVQKMKELGMDKREIEDIIKGIFEEGGK